MIVHISDREERFIDTVFYLSSNSFSKEESINDSLFISYIYNIRALPLFQYFLWYPISLTTRGPFNYSRCGITPTVIFVRANAVHLVPLFILHPPSAPVIFLAKNIF